jgi:hypothetical protein
VGQKEQCKRRGFYSFFCACIYIYIYIKIINLEQFFLAHHRIISAVKTVETVSDRSSYIVLRVRWCNTIALNMNAPSVKKGDNSKTISMRN